MVLNKYISIPIHDKCKKAAIKKFFFKKKGETNLTLLLFNEKVRMRKFYILPSN